MKLQKLILSGGGDEIQTRIIDEYFASMLNIDQRLLYIPVAMEANVEAYNECYEWLTGVFRPLGVTCFEMWTDLDDKRLEDLRCFSAVYIGGGNTFHLLKKLKDTKFSELLSQYISEGGIVYGGSAGGIILGSHIETCALNDDNTTGMMDYSGLGCIGSYAIHCHYERGQEGFIHSLTSKWNKPVIALSEETGIAVQGNQIKVIGKQPAHVFDGKNTFEIGVGKVIEWKE